MQYKWKISIALQLKKDRKKVLVARTNIFILWIKNNFFLHFTNMFHHVLELLFYSLLSKFSLPLELHA